MPDKRQEQFDALMGRISSHLPPEGVEQIKSVFAAAPQAALQLGEEVLAKSDYTRRVQEVALTEQQLAQERTALTELSTKVSQYDAYLQQNYLPRDQYEAVVAERNRFATQFEQLTSQYPTLMEELGLPTGTQHSQSQNQNQNQGDQQVNNQFQNPNPGVQPTPPAAPSTPTNPIQHVTQLAWNQEKQSLSALAMLSPAIQHDLAVRHQQLFGAPLANLTEIVNEAGSSGRSLEDIWAEKYNVAARQQQLAAEQLEATVAERVNTELAKRTSAMAINGGGIPNNGLLSPFLTGNANIPQDQLASPGNGIGGAPDMTRIANQGSGRGTAAQAATAAYLSGKYANEKFDIIRS